MTEHNMLRAAIYARYKSKSELAEKLGWSKQKLHYAINNPDRMKLYQINQIIEALGLENDDNAFRIFLPVEANKISQD